MKHRFLFLVLAIACGSANGAPPPEMCATKSVWTGGNSESPRMRPGAACIDCHSRGEGPLFTIAGTVSPTMTELTDCNGTNNAGTLRVEITGSDGAILSLPVNEAGNFYTREKVVMPFHAKVVSSNGHQLSMTDAQATGDCNSCHTQLGAHGAPGRIMAPQ